MSSDRAKRQYAMAFFTGSNGSNRMMKTFYYIGIDYISYYVLVKVDSAVRILSGCIRSRSPHGAIAEMVYLCLLSLSRKAGSIPMSVFLHRALLNTNFFIWGIFL